MRPTSAPGTMLLSQSDQTCSPVGFAELPQKMHAATALPCPHRYAQASDREDSQDWGQRAGSQARRSVRQPRQDRQGRPAARLSQSSPEVLRSGYSSLSGSSSGASRTVIGIVLALSSTSSWIV